MKYFLYPLSVIYRVLVFIKNFCYDNKLIKTHHLPCSVISVGNITSGGTGKTPTVLHLCKILQQKSGNNIGIISRGYGRNTKGTILVSKGDGPLRKWESVGDEPFMIAEKTRNIPIVVDSDRYRGGLFLNKHYNTEIIIIDDGFQHRSLSRDLNIVLINGDTNPSDYKFLPLGYLREPWSSLKRADAIIFTKRTPKSFLIKKVEKSNINYLNSYLNSFMSFPNEPKTQKIKKLKGETVILLSGIGDPKSLETTISNYNCLVKGYKIFRDHYHYNKKNISEIIKFAKNKNADYIITTEKDWVKIKPLKPNFPFIIINIEIDFTEKNSIDKLIEDHLMLN